MIIPPRFNGPPDSANGGYAAGMLATYVAAPQGAEVTLRRPPPLATPLDVTTSGDTIELYDGEHLVAAARPVAEPIAERVPPVAWAEAMTAASTYAGFVAHPFPTCFACGPQRPPGDGLRLFPGRLPDGRTAAPWVVPEDIDPTLVWAALDCPGGWAVQQEQRPHVLGRLAARVDALPAAGDGCVVTGALLAVDGRKAQVATTLYASDGKALAVARATWIAVSPASA